MGSLFDKLESEAYRRGLQKRSKEAQDWFKSQLRGMAQINMHKMLKDDRLKTKQRPRIGDMFMYIYDPKHRKTLPYYDRFPLTIMVSKAPGGFYGLNLHYLPLKQRAMFLDRLTDIANNKKFDETTRLKLNYSLLKSAKKYKYFAPCFKHYLTSQINSKIVKVEASEWDIAIFLPTENFAKKKKGFVWKQSKRKY
jgi:Fe-S oxidoreductase